MSLATPLDLDVFQGPLDLLLQLVERRKLEITEVSLAAVAGQYLQAVRALPERDLELLSEFLAIGTRLLLLKSRALLPRPPPLDDEEEPVDDLTARLEEYRHFKGRRWRWRHASRPGSRRSGIESGLIRRRCSDRWRRSKRKRWPDCGGPSRGDNRRRLWKQHR